MKKMKKLFVFLFALVVMFGFTNTVKADSYDSSNEMKGKIVVRTTINNWSSTNDLVYDVDVNDNFVNDTDGWLYSNNNYYTKTAYLEGKINNVTTQKNLSFQDYNLDQNNNFNFDEGTTVTLVEIYDFNDYLNEQYRSSFADYEQNQDALSGNIGNSITSIISEDKLKFSWEDDDTLDSFDRYILSYTKGTNFDASRSIYFDYVYDSENISTSRNIVEYLYSSNDNTTKSNIITRDLNVPRYRVYGSLSAKGNIAGLTEFQLQLPDSRTCYCGHSSCSGYFSDYGSNEPANLSYEEIKYVLENSPIAYGAGGGSGATVYTYGNSWSDANMSQDWSDGVLTVSFTQSGTENVSVPNGLFYNILPFVIILGIAGAGFVILKKNKVKES